VHVKKNEEELQEFVMEESNAAIQAPTGPSVEELKKLEAAKKKLDRYKVVEKKEDVAAGGHQGGESLKE